MSVPRDHRPSGFWQSGLGQFVALVLNLIVLAFVMILSVLFFFAYLWITLGTFGYGMQWFTHTPEAWWKFLCCAAVTFFIPIFVPSIGFFWKRIVRITVPASAAKSALRCAKWNAEGIRIWQASIDAQNAKALLDQFNGGLPLS